MEFDMNNLRMQLAFSFDELTKKLNRCILQEKEYGTSKSGKMIEGDILIDSDEIEIYMHQTRSHIWTLLCVFQDGDENFTTVFEQVQKNGGMEIFNEKEEEK
jgi:hypothetical protein